MPIISKIFVKTIAKLSIFTIVYTRHYETVLARFLMACSAIFQFYSHTPSRFQQLHNFDKPLIMYALVS